MALGKHCGTSWEGTEWVSCGGLLARFRWGVDARVGSMLLALAAPTLAVLTALFLSAPAFASATCSTEAWKPFPSGDTIWAKSVAHCSAAGKWHRFGTRVFKNVNNWPDTLVGGTEVSSKRAHKTTWAHGEPRGCGQYYSTGWVKYHVWDRSNRNYWRC